jgi:hypothetical protein
MQHVPPRLQPRVGSEGLVLVRRQPEPRAHLGGQSEFRSSALFWGARGELGGQRARVEHASACPVPPCDLSMRKLEEGTEVVGPTLEPASNHCVPLFSGGGGGGGAAAGKQPVITPQVPNHITHAPPYSLTFAAAGHA